MLNFNAGILFIFKKNRPLLYLIAIFFFFLDSFSILKLNFFILFEKKNPSVVGSFHSVGTELKKEPSHGKVAKGAYPTKQHWSGN